MADNDGIADLAGVLVDDVSSVREAVGVCSVPVGVLRGSVIDLKLGVYSTGGSAIGDSCWCDGSVKVYQVNIF